MILKCKLRQIYYEVCPMFYILKVNANSWHNIKVNFGFTFYNAKLDITHQLEWYFIVPAVINGILIPWSPVTQSEYLSSFGFVFKDTMVYVRFW